MTKLNLESLKLKVNTIWSGRDFSIKFSELDQEQQAVFFKIFVDILPIPNIDHGTDFNCIIGCLDKEQRASVIDRLKPNLAGYFMNHCNLAKTFKLLDAELCAVVCDTVQEKWELIIKNGYKFPRIGLLNIDKQNIIFDSIKAKFPLIIKSTNDLSEVLKGLNVKHRSEVIELMKDKLPELVKDVYQFMVILEPLNHQQRLIVCDYFKHNFEDIIHNDTEHQILLKGLQFPKAMSMKSREPSNALKSVFGSRMGIFGIILSLAAFAIPFLGYSSIIGYGLIAASSALVHVANKKYNNFMQLSYPLFFKSLANKEMDKDELDDDLKSYNLGKEASQSWKGYFTSFVKPSAYKHYDAFCTGQLEADGIKESRKPTP